MCFESTKIGFETFDSQERVVVGSSSEEVVARGQGRRVLMFGPPSAGRVTLYPNEAAVDRQGFVLNWNDPPLLLRVEDHGDLVERSWHGISVAGDGPVTAGFNADNSALNASVTASVAAVADRRHRVLGYSGAWDTAGTIGGLRLRIDGFTLNAVFLYDALQMDFTGRSFLSGANQLVEAILDDGGVGVTGRVNVWGETIDAGDGEIVLPIFQGVFKKSRLDSSSRQL